MTFLIKMAQLSNSTLLMILKQSAIMVNLSMNTLQIHFTHGFIIRIIPDSAKLKTLQRVSKKCESSHYIFREQGGVYEREQ